MAKVAVDLVGPLAKTDRGNRWIPIFTDHFTRRQYALAIPDATAPIAASTLEERALFLLGIARTKTHG